MTIHPALVFRWAVLDSIFDFTPFIFLGLLLLFFLLLVVLHRWLVPALSAVLRRRND